MQAKNASYLNAQKLRLILVGTILLILVISIVIFVFARNVLSSYASEVQEVDATAASSSKNLSELSQLQEKLANNQESVLRARNLVAESRSYTYQDQIIRDVNNFADKSGVAITVYQFNNEGTETSSTPSGGSSSSAPATSSPSAAQSSGIANATTTVSGLKTVSVNVTVKTPVSYEAIMNFIHMIEQNLTKMQLKGISLTRDPTPNSNKVITTSLTIEVYVH